MPQTKSNWYWFYWSPEGRIIARISSDTIEHAKSIFKREHKKYAQFMGEVYIEFHETQY